MNRKPADTRSNVMARTLSINAPAFVVSMFLHSEGSHRDHLKGFIIVSGIFSPK